MEKFLDVDYFWVETWEEIEGGFFSSNSVRIALSFLNRKSGTAELTSREFEETESICLRLDSFYLILFDRDAYLLIFFASKGVIMGG